MKIALLAKNANMNVDQLFISRRKESKEKLEARSLKLARQLIVKGFGCQAHLQKNTRILAKKLLTFPEDDEVKLYVHHKPSDNSPESVFDTSMLSESDQLDQSSEEPMNMSITDSSYDTMISSLETSHTMSCEDMLDLKESDNVEESSSISKIVVVDETPSESSSLLKDDVIQHIRDFPRFRAHHARRIMEILRVEESIDEFESDTESTAESTSSNFSDEIIEEEKAESVTNNKEKYSLLKLMSENNLR